MTGAGPVPVPQVRIACHGGFWNTGVYVNGEPLEGVRSVEFKVDASGLATASIVVENVELDAIVEDRLKWGQLLTTEADPADVDSTDVPEVLREIVRRLDDFKGFLPEIQFTLDGGRLVARLDGHKKAHGLR